MIDSSDISWIILWVPERWDITQLGSGALSNSISSGPSACWAYLEPFLLNDSTMCDIYKTTLGGGSSPYPTIVPILLILPETLESFLMWVNDELKQA